MLVESRELQQMQWLELQQPSQCEATVTEVKGEITVSWRTWGQAHNHQTCSLGKQKEGRAGGKQALIALAGAKGVQAFHRVGLRSPV